MKTYKVDAICYYTIEVEADNEDEAFDMACDTPTDEWDFDKRLSFDEDDVTEID